MRAVRWINQRRNVWGTVKRKSCDIAIQLGLTLRNSCLYSLWRCIKTIAMKRRHTANTCNTFFCAGTLDTDTCLSVAFATGLWLTGHGEGWRERNERGKRTRNNVLFKTTAEKITCECHGKPHKNKWRGGGKGRPKSNFKGWKTYCEKRMAGEKQKPHCREENRLRFDDVIWPIKRQAKWRMKWQRGGWRKTQVIHRLRWKIQELSNSKHTHTQEMR